MAARLVGAPRLLERAAETEVRERVDRCTLDDGAEFLARLRVPARAEVSAPERLADRGLVRLEPAGLLERDRGGRVVARLEQRAAALEEVVDVRPVVAHGASLPQDPRSHA